MERNFSLFLFVRLLSIMCNLTEINLFKNLKCITTEFVTKLIGFDILNVICILILVLNLNSFFHSSMIFKALFKNKRFVLDEIVCRKYYCKICYTNENTRVLLILFLCNLLDNFIKLEPLIFEECSTTL